MPVGQVLAVQASRAYRIISQEFEKLWLLPYADSASRFAEVGAQLQERGYWTQSFASKEIIPVASLLLPAIQATRTAQERLNRDVAVLQAVEAIRLHAAETGKLPAKMADITAVPVPKNPVTGKIFDYRLDGVRAVLDTRNDGGLPQAKRFEITLRDNRQGNERHEESHP